MLLVSIVYKDNIKLEHSENVKKKLNKTKNFHKSVDVSSEENI